MIEAEHSVEIAAPIEAVWAYVQEIRRWSNLLPGCQECVVIDAAQSHWVLKVGTAGLVRTVKVLVRVDEWNGPEQVNFSYQLLGDPVVGGGCYLARASTPVQTNVTLRVRVQGSGPLAPMWEAMSRPVLPRMAAAFATRLKAEIENSTAHKPPSETVERPSSSSPLAAVGKKIRSIWSTPAIDPAKR